MRSVQFTSPELPSVGSGTLDEVGTSVCSWAYRRRKVMFDETVGQYPWKTHQNIRSQTKWRACAKVAQTALRANLLSPHGVSVYSGLGAGRTTEAAKGNLPLGFVTSGHRAAQT
uniref:Uncharacterized protein n=1 Tax=Mesocestoides corti TaxID=53468 RepID=A0A5K3FFA3_MESCO